MNPEIAMAVAREHHHDLIGPASRHQAGRARRRRPRWHVSWIRMSVGAGPGRPRSSWVIIISPGRPG